MEVVQKVEDVVSISESTHWFCPRDGESSDIFFDEDLSIVDPSYLKSEPEGERAKRQKVIDETSQRTDKVLDACTILAFDGNDARPYQDKLKSRLATQLIRCDVCIREFHRARGRLKSSLEGQYDTDEVQSFMETFDHMNKSRIVDGLTTAKEELQKTPTEKRTIKSAGDKGMYAMFEALNCIPLLQDEEALQQHFDPPFEMAQSRKKVKLPGYSPGMISFVYTASGIRPTWAQRNLTVITSSMTPKEFDYSVEPFLKTALSRVHISYLDERFLPVFWKGTRAILSKLDTELITSKLGAMEANLWKMSLEHFQLNLPHFDDLIQSYAILLERGPQQFWRSMETIGPQSVLDTIFKAPRLDQATVSADKPEELQLCFSWIDPFIGSIQANNLVPPVRTIADQFLHRYQNEKYSKLAREIAFEIGFRAVLKALRTLRESGNRGPIVSQLLEFISKEHLGTVMQQLDGVEKKDEMRLSKIQEVCLQIIEVSLALDCRSIGFDRQTIMQTEGSDYQASVSELNIWKLSLKSIKPGHPTLAAAVVVGIQELAGLDAFSPRQVEKWKKPATSFNKMLEQVNGYVVEDILERLQNFSSEQLSELLEDQRAVPGLFALLFNGEPVVHQAALDLFKTSTGEDGRRSTIMHLAKVNLCTTLHGTGSAVKTIARWKGYTPCPNMLRLITDVYSCLCDDTDGLLRSGRKHSTEDSTALEGLWQATWLALNVIFENTEAWSQLGHDKRELENFCRATMDCAELAFEQLPLFTGTISQQGSTKDVSKRLLDRPKAVFHNITKWLRLRDDYLITRAVRLTCRMLSRLQDAGIIVSKDAASIVQGVLTGKVKTRMSTNQKAEIQRALEYHFGELFQEATDFSASMPKKQSSLQDWTSSAATSGRSTPDVSKPRKPGIIDVDAWSAAAAKAKQDPVGGLQGLLNKASSTTPAQRQQLELLKKQAASKPAIKTVRAIDDERRRTEFKLKRQQEKEEADRRRAEALAKANGTVGVGSGVQGLGNIGKDHSLKGQNVMVSSDEESESEGDDFDQALFGDIKKKVRPSTLGPGIKPAPVRGPTKIHRTQRSAKDMRARLAPNLQSLHRIILQWDFFHNGDYPPTSKEHEFKQVSNVFNDPSTYQETFQPLLVLEAWQGMVKSREENSSKPYEIKIQGRSNVDHFIEISSSVSHAENRDLQLQEGDIVLLSQAKKPQDNPDSPHCLARIYRLKRQKAHLETVYQVMPGSGLERHMNTQAIIHGIKIQSIIPLEREYGALQALQYYDLCNQIVRARPSNRMTFSDKQIAAFQDNWNVNRAQSEAINAALVNEGFSLIQGPPGSGKTKTIVAIVGGLLSDQLSSGSKATKINVPGQPNGRAENEAPPRKLLVCAPSNAAVDELVMRMKDGVRTKSGRECAINIVRIGRSDAINTQVLDVTMDELVSKRLGTTGPDQESRAKSQELFKEHERVSAELRELHEKRDSGKVKGSEAAELQDQIVAVRKRKNELGSKIDSVKDQERNAGREAELNRKRAQQAVLDQAHVICATLSGSGHDLFQSMNVEFETVIIDEAAQCVEMSSLIPLKYGCVKCIMVGDPKQLPPTVFSKEAARFQYEQSLFVRMQNNFPKEVHLLDTQYRMHPAISIFPSRTFYDGLLKDGDGMAGLRARPWHASELLAPYRFFDVQGQQQASKGHSLTNSAEVDVAMALYSRLRTDFSNYDLQGKVGVITPYKSQLRLLKDRFSTKFGRDVFEIIEFNTTDAFQGRESEIIIFSCVRASPAGGIGFLQDIRRMNVGLTRAKSSLWVLGNSDSLVRGRYWKMLVEDAKGRSSYTTGDILRMLAAPSSKFPASKHKDEAMHDAPSHKLTNGKSEVPASRHVDSGRMEGVTYRFEDRVKAKRPAPPEEGSRAVSRARVDVTDGDTEMADAESSASTSTVNGDCSRDSTPQISTAKAAQHTTPAGPTAAKQPTSVPAGKTIRRPAADPFIRPRKR